MGCFSDPHCDNERLEENSTEAQVFFRISESASKEVETLLPEGDAERLRQNLLALS